jgi:hypothetical protein
MSHSIQKSASNMICECGNGEMRIIFNDDDTTIYQCVCCEKTHTIPELKQKSVPEMKCESCGDVGICITDNGNEEIHQCACCGETMYVNTKPKKIETVKAKPVVQICTDIHCKKIGECMCEYADKAIKSEIEAKVKPVSKKCTSDDVDSRYNGHTSYNAYERIYNNKYMCEEICTIQKPKKSETKVKAKKPEVKFYDSLIDKIYTMESTISDKEMSVLKLSTEIFVEKSAELTLQNWKQQLETNCSQGIPYVILEFRFQNNAHMPRSPLELHKYTSNIGTVDVIDGMYILDINKGNGPHSYTNGRKHIYINGAPCIIDKIKEIIKGHDSRFNVTRINVQELANHIFFDRIERTSVNFLKISV